MDNTFTSKSLPANMLLRMQAVYGSLKRAERSAADLLLSEPNLVSVSTIATVANLAGVSQPTFVRLARRLGFDGFAELKEAIVSANLSNNDTRTPETHYQEISKNDSHSLVAEKIIRSAIQSMEDLLCMLDHEQYNKAADAIIKATHIGFFGVGDAAIVAQSGFHKFHRIGINCNASSDPDVQLMLAAQLKTGDVCVLISHSGASRSTVNAARSAKESGATTIGITNYPYSQLARVCDIVLLTSSFVAHSGEVITKRISEMVLLESLFMNMLLRGGSQYTDAMERSYRALEPNKL